MSNITKKQVSLAAIAVVFATTLIASIAFDSAYARIHAKQIIAQHNHATVSANSMTTGGGSTITGSSNPIVVQANTNSGGNGAQDNTIEED